MKLYKRESLWAGVIYFLILLSIALWVRDIPNQLDAFNLTLRELIKTSTMGDPASFATAAIDIAENGWISSENDWIFNLWPPGFILLEALIMRLMGPDAPVILILQLLAAILFSAVLLLLANLLKGLVNNKVVYTLPLLIFAFPVSRAFLLQPTGISLGESFSIGFFMLSILLAYQSVEKKSFLNAAYAGLFLALSAYFRSQFDLILLALTGWGGLLLIVFIISLLCKTTYSPNLKSTVKTIGILLLTAHAATVPWRAYHWINHESLNWVQTSTLTFENSVMTSDYLESVGGAFVVAGAGNLVCHIDPAACGDRENAKTLFFKTFINHPLEWYKLKFDVIGKYWFSSVGNWVTVATKASGMDIVVNTILLLMFFVAAVLLATRKIRNHTSWILLVWFNASLLSAYGLIFSLAHFEARYFYFPKIASVLMLIIVASLYFRSSNKMGGGNAIIGSSCKC